MNRKSIAREIDFVDSIMQSHFNDYGEETHRALQEAVRLIGQEPKIERCKDCKWWKDSDGLYRRGGHAESKCPINRREVFEGNGYCYMFEQKTEMEG